MCAAVRGYTPVLWLHLGSSDLHCEPFAHQAISSLTLANSGVHLCYTLTRQQVQKPEEGLEVKGVVLPLGLKESNRTCNFPVLTQPNAFPSLKCTIRLARKGQYRFPGLLWESRN